ncbi:hypothetical protein [Helicobacter sp.]|uniref:hypothetical protein n=1 Tax=Helicobacter sp. TaxID=218 RepID=UPI00198742C5|nr:hypothetical protein [Helicobacter sp.]MBD5164964.1 hypothetical protein [Helicobacter sp.]
MEKNVIFGAATGGKEVANKLLNNGGGGGRRIRFYSLSIMTPKNTGKCFVFKVENMK